MSDSILDSVAKRPTVKRDTSVKADTPAQKMFEEGDLNKRTVRLSDPTTYYFNKLKLSDRVSVDCLLEAIAIYCQDHPAIEKDLVIIAKKIGKKRQDKGNRDRAKAMAKKFL